jgi:hypothetical protein
LHTPAMTCIVMHRRPPWATPPAMKGRADSTTGGPVLHWPARCVGNVLRFTLLRPGSWLLTRWMGYSRGGCPL